ncbi:flagellin lysine-N-methylase [Fusibacter paucivorans]|uniref:Flagellin lysine-N-methylase n=1 Tax=Fusibacter paucivorans TaxID=76009 RepID=A0ABS5PS44_9FIRM|nr:flagellin lysine-N-methylase [Fusibacter paucivorans]MBS7527692.1 flagellin lysine-N-methylase [Fusibacter paucivorans]
MRKLKYIRPSYYTDFTCIAGECEDNCCMGWFVDLDDRTYRKYQKIRHPELTPIIQQTVRRNEQCDAPEINYATVRLTKQQNCAFLDDHRLCRIQAAYGESYLSNVCSLYPRIINQVNGRIEMSLSASCPEALRKYLFLEDGIVFEEGVAAMRLPIITYDVFQRAPKYAGTPVADLKLIREVSNDILSDRDLSFAERLFVLGDYLWQARKDPRRKKMIMPSKTVFSELWKSDFVRMAFQNLDVDKQIVSKRYRKWHFHARDFYEHASKDALKSAEKLFSDYFNHHVYVFENYFVNLSFRNLFPFTEVDDIFDAYCLFVMRYGMMAYDLIGNVGSGVILDQSSLIEYFQSFSKAIEHHQHFFQSFVLQLQSERLNNWKYISRL